MASTVSFNGVNSAVPQVLSKIDASALETVGLGASGIVALIGDGVGGIPVSSSLVPDDFIRLTKPIDARTTFRSGDLREAAAMCFSPSTDPAVPAGAQEIVCMKTNPATQSSATFANTIGDALTVTSVDYGAFTEQINVTIANGTDAGRLPTVTFETTTETLDNVGLVDDTNTGNETAMFELNYTEPAAAPQGWDTMTADILSTGVRCYGTRSEVGLDSEITLQAGNGAVLTMASDGADTRTVTVYGLDATGAAIRETFTLNGAATVTGAVAFTTVLGAEASATDPARTVTIQNSTPATVITIGTGVLTRGLVQANAMFVGNGTVLMVSDIANPGAGATATADMVLWGLSASGAVQSEQITISGTTTIRTTSSWSRIDKIVMGDIDAAPAATITFYAIAANAPAGTYDTLTKLQDYFNARQVDVGASTFGFNFNMLTSSTTLNPNLLDYTSTPTDIDVAAASAPGFPAVLNALEGFFDNTSVLTNATRVAFTRKVFTVTVTNAGATGAWVLNIDGSSISFTSDASPTVTEVAAGLAAVVNRTIAVMNYVTATSSAGVLTLTGVTPRTGGGFVTSLTSLPGGGAAWSLAATTAQSGSGQPPTNTTSAVFLSGGVEGTTTFNQFQTALDKLKLIDVNTIVALSGDPAVHAAVEAHCAFMAGEGKSERDAVVGLSAIDASNNPTGALPSKASIKAQILSINSRHVRACAQTIDRYNTEGVSTTFMPWFQAAVVAGMQAGSPIGTPLTRKVMSVDKIDQDSGWNPLDDAHEMIQAGLWFAEAHRTGIRNVRNVTTYLIDNNIAFIEASVNEAVNFAVFNLRNNLETIVGEKGFAGTVSAAKSAAQNVLNELVDQGVIGGWQSLTAELNVDTLDIAVEIQPPVPVNFVPVTVHLTTLSIAA